MFIEITRVFIEITRGFTGNLYKYRFEKTIIIKQETNKNRNS